MRPNRDGAAYAETETIVVEATMAETITAATITMGMNRRRSLRVRRRIGDTLSEDGPADSQGAT